VTGVRGKKGEGHSISEKTKQKRGREERGKYDTLSVWKGKEKNGF